MITDTRSQNIIIFQKLVSEVSLDSSENAEQIKPIIFIRKIYNFSHFMQVH